MSPTSKLILQLVFGALGVVITLGWLTRRATDPREAFTWARAYRVEVTPLNRAMIVRFVRVSITLRGLGAVSGLVLGSLFDRGLGLRTSTGVGFWVWVLLGWIAGGAWAEARYVPPNRAADMTASLTPRRVADYLPAAVHWAPPAGAALTSGVAVLGLVAGPPAQPEVFGVATPSDLWLLIVGSMIITALALWGEQRVVDRRQPAAHPDVTAADDAIRASTVHLLGAGSTAAILLLGAHAAGGVLGPRQLPFGMRGWVPVLFILGALFSSRYMVYRAWRVRRPRPNSEAPAAVPPR